MVFVSDAGDVGCGDGEGREELESKVIILSLPPFLLSALRMPYSLNFLFISPVVCTITLLVRFLFPISYLGMPQEAGFSILHPHVFVSEFTPLGDLIQVLWFDYCHLHLNGSQNCLQ